MTRSSTFLARCLVCGVAAFILLPAPADAARRKKPVEDAAAPSFEAERETLWRVRAAEQQRWDQEQKKLEDAHLRYEEAERKQREAEDQAWQAAREKTFAASREIQEPAAPETAEPVHMARAEIETWETSAVMTTESAVPREEVTFETREKPGTIVVDTTQRRLYFVLGDNRALRYGIGVGRPGFEWAGVKFISQKSEWPDWRPPDTMIERRPDLPRFMPGGPHNPLGARAMYLGSSIYRIHGSNEPNTIGQAVSSGCIRMTNADVQDLYGRTSVGTKVIVR